MQIISSKDNKLIKHIAKLKDKKYRNEFNEFVVEGAKIVQEAFEENALIKDVVVSDSAMNSEFVNGHLDRYLKDFDFVQVPDEIFKFLSDTQNPQGVLAVIAKNNLDGKIDLNQNFILALDEIQDPGNLGTIIRTADAVGLKQILVSKGTVDIYNSKVLRSTMGAIFRIDVIVCESLVDELEELKNCGFEIMITSLKNSKCMYDVDFDKKVVVIGNEANGVSKEILDISNQNIIIPMKGKTESLNASVATGVILYEYLRRNYNK